MKKSRVLKFECRGGWYKVKENGDMLQVDNTYNEWDGNWRFLGVSFHHWTKHVELTCKETFKNPKALLKGIVWDVDHGTTRLWGGSYCGRLPRITAAYIEEGSREREVGIWRPRR